MAKANVPQTASDRRLSVNSVKLEDELERSLSSPASINSSNNRAPIAHMESEEEFTSRSLGLDGDPTMLFSIEAVAEALKVENFHKSILN